MSPEDDYDPDQPSDADAELLGELQGEHAAELHDQADQLGLTDAQSENLAGRYFPLP